MCEWVAAAPLDQPGDLLLVLVITAVLVGLLGARSACMLAREVECGMHSTTLTTESEVRRITRTKTPSWI